jgi:nucleoside-diphosphate-sugar epimerase
MSPSMPELSNRIENRSVLLIGGAGFIGSALLPKLLDDGWQVRILDLLLFGREPIAEWIDHPRVELVQGDFRNPDLLADAMQGMDSVINLGGIVGDPACDWNKELTMDVNLEANNRAVLLAKQSGIQRFVFASTALVYGASQELLDESSAIQPLTIYSQTKYDSEKYLLDSGDNTFTPVVLRVTTVYGLSGRLRFDLVVNLLTAKALFDGVITIHGGQQQRSFVHVEDAARGFALALGAPDEKVHGQVFNLGSNEQRYSILQIGEMIQQKVPSAHLVIQDINDPIDFRIRCSKIREMLDFQPDWSLERGIDQVVESVQSGKVTDYRDARYSNYLFIKEKGYPSFAVS